MTTHPICPDCGGPMHRAGRPWSGRHKVQRYKCPKCGGTTVKQPVSGKPEEGAPRSG